jgi:hypothetical protein
MASVALGMILIWRGGVEGGSADTVTLGFVLVTVGAIGTLLSLLLWSTEPVRVDDHEQGRPRRDRLALRSRLRRVTVRPSRVRSHGVKRRARPR